MLISIAASENLQFLQFHVKTAFLYGELQEEVFKKQPEGYDDKSTRVPDSKFNLQQSCNSLALQVCKLAASLTRQDRKFITNFQKHRSHHVSNLQQTCHVKFIANQ
ncbi:hypothetical protein AVEN_173044-1 [Araneus ventricosus]|uniref:Reverse transcriptase Ty1/copia-type domain-containing protein n=1 Tax=Araneus ventricosus TaxID=182803 RepID=A0A4Y2K280_ARAVE|nr:hypothetical protein AVEN_173044-1 [Araneus ventricosus]